jgi:hypothetical protein
VRLFTRKDTDLCDRSQQRTGFPIRPSAGFDPIRLLHTFPKSDPTFTCIPQVCFLQKQFLERKGFFGLHVPIMANHPGITGQAHKAGTEAEAMEGCCLLACSHGLLSLLLHPTQDHLLIHGFTHSELGLFTAIVNQENVPQTCPQANPRGLFSGEALSFQMALTCVKLTKTDKSITPGKSQLLVSHNGIRSWVWGGLWSGELGDVRDGETPGIALSGSGSWSGYPFPQPHLPRAAKGIPQANGLCISSKEVSEPVTLHERYLAGPDCPIIYGNIQNSTRLYTRFLEPSASGPRNILCPQAHRQDRVLSMPFTANIETSSTSLRKSFLRAHGRRHWAPLAIQSPGQTLLLQLYQSPRLIQTPRCSREGECADSMYIFKTSLFGALSRCSA